MTEKNNINNTKDKKAPEAENTVPENASNESEEIEKLKISDELEKTLKETEEPISDDQKEKEEAERVAKLEMSDELREALLEAESCLSEKGDIKSETSPSEPSDADDQEGEDGFDPNAVDEKKEEAIEVPSPKEVELKMEILDLRHKLRLAEAQIENKISEMKQNVDEAKRLKGHFDSYKTRVMKEKADQFNYGHEPLLKELLPVVDNFSRALTHAEKEADLAALIEGVDLILRQLLAVMSKFNVEKIESMGKEFNPGIHQAMNQIPDNSVPPNTVVAVHQEGYLLKDRLLRPAMVGVSKKDVDSSADNTYENDSGEKEGEVSGTEKKEDE